MESAIICVDDDWDILKSLGEQLKRYFGEHYLVELCQSGDEAISTCWELSDDGRKHRIGDVWLKEKRVKDNRSCTRIKNLS
ncbi:hypothetical protein [Acaryochloris sp. CCMEE 5410]|uniref:hypothetical protein n=1 Tax=Acaryochloris sp. CCMEE 5410 TaxID=310037 RepID=UPI0021CDFB48|nr:hypothetical protein [Acaryochloris sp. CCMEE 5410]KAI9130321.1 hypothetical protein ON05_021000 [Acaryochloris sp. CCMEE 5410]